MLQSPDPILAAFTAQKALVTQRRTSFGLGPTPRRAGSAGANGPRQRTRPRRGLAVRPWPTLAGSNANRAADWITFGKFLNAGPVCIAPDHPYVHASVKDRFLTLLRYRIARACGNDAESPNLARIVNDHHARRLSGLITDALAKGTRPILDNGAKGRSTGPMLVEAITPEMRLDQEEIFGPILPP